MSSFSVTIDYERQARIFIRSISLYPRGFAFRAVHLQ